MEGWDVVMQKAQARSGVNVEVKVRAWAEAQKNNVFMAEAPIFLELSYYGTSCDEKFNVLIGQGTTFDSGGLSLKVYIIATLEQ